MHCDLQVGEQTNELTVQNHNVVNNYNDTKRDFVNALSLCENRGSCQSKEEVTVTNFHIGRV